MQNNTSFKVILSVSIVTIILFAQISSVAAANNQGLEWGIEVDDRFDYDFDVSYHNSTFDLDLTGEMYVIVNVLGDIADDIVALMNIPIASLYSGTFTVYWNNGTVMDDFWLGIPFMGSAFLYYPIGNWTLMAELFEDAFPTGVTQDATTLNYTIVDVPQAGNVISQVFQKSNGVAMSQQYHVAWSDTTADVEFTLKSSSSTTTTTTTTTNTTSGTTGSAGTGDSTLILILGGGTAIVIVVIVIIFMRRK
jgi:hypothetical protein